MGRHPPHRLIPTIDPTDQGMLPDEVVPIFGSDTWTRLPRADKDNVRHHYLAGTNSPFLHGEQGALICSAKIVSTTPELDSKFYAATQTTDEARHVETYAELTEPERGEREEFVIEASALLRDRLLAREVWENPAFDADAPCAYVDQHRIMTEFRKALFSRVVRTVKDIGLWGDEVQRTYERMGVLGCQDLDIEELSDNDERIAAEMEELLAARAEGRPIPTDGSRAAEMAAKIATGENLDGDDVA